MGEHLKYLVYSQDRPIACLAWSSAPRHLGCRDRFIGWSAEARGRNIRFIAYNLRFLILPWVRGSSPGLAPPGAHGPDAAARTGSGSTGTRCTSWRPSWIRSGSGARATGPPTGSCLGRTTGRGKNDQTRRPNRPIKEVLGYPLRRDFRERLCADGMKTLQPINGSNWAWTSGKRILQRAGRSAERRGLREAQGAGRILRLPR